MKKSLIIFCLFYSTALWAGLGDPYTYTLTTPPNHGREIPPTPFDLPVPPWPTDESLEPLEIVEPFTARLSSLYRPKQIRVENAPGIEHLPVLCHVQIIKDLCQANYLSIQTDHGEYIKSPLERLTPESYFAVAGFADYFDLSMRGYTPCTVMVSCDYIMQ